MIPPSPVRSWMIGLGVVAVPLILFLIFGETPWEAKKAIAERAEVGRKPRVENYMAIGLWWAAVGNLVLVGVLFAGVKFWSRRFQPDEADEKPAPARAGRWFWIALGLIVLTGGALRWNLAHRSLWWDELWCAKFAIAGYYLGSPDDPREERRYGESSWKRALWYYSKPTNHGVASLPARLSHLAWRQFARPAEVHAISDFAIRLPTFLASLGAMVAVGCLGLAWRRPWTGLLAALLLAIHPWHVRYGIDVRAYSYLVLWTALGCLWLTRIVQTGGTKWRWWLAFGLNQFLVVWSFPVAVFLAAAFFLAAFVLVLIRWKGAGRITALSRLVFVNLLAVMLWLPLVAPLVPQALAFIESDSAQHVGHEVSARYLQEFASRVTIGLPFRWGNAEHARGFPDLWTRTASGVHWGAWGLIAAGVLVGTVALWRKQRDALVILSGIAAGSILTIAFFRWSDGYFYPRFLIFMLIPFVWLVAEGWRFLFGWIRGRTGWIGTGILLFTFVWMILPQLRLLVSRPYEPLRDVAAIYSAQRATGDELVYVGYGHGVETLPVYFPEIHKAVSKAELESFIQRARNSEARLLVTVGHLTFNRHVVPDGFDLLDDPERFREITTFNGIEPSAFFRVLEWTGD